MVHTPDRPHGAGTVEVPPGSSCGGGSVGWGPLHHLLSRIGTVGSGFGSYTGLSRIGTFTSWGFWVFGSVCEKKKVQSGPHMKRMIAGWDRIYFERTQSSSCVYLNKVCEVGLLRKPRELCSAREM